VEVVENLRISSIARCCGYLFAPGISLINIYDGYDLAGVGCQQESLA